VSNVPRIVNCISEPPLFESGFHLQQNSKCKDRGALPVTWGTTSVNGEEDSGNSDLGFHYPAIMGGAM